jgi:large subunit ribosomal protein L1
MNRKLIEKSKLVDRTKRVDIVTGIELAKKTATAKFDETLGLAVKLAFDLKKSGGSVRGTVVLPGGSGKSKKVAVLAVGDAADKAKAAGADVVGGDDLIAKIQGGFFGFDVLLTTPDMMPTVAKLGKVLGTKGLMPNPKSGTVTTDISKTVAEFKGGKVEFKADKTGVINLGIGKMSFTADNLKKNFDAVVSAILKAKPTTVKGDYVKSVTLSSTMGPGIKLDSKKIFAVAGSEK